MSFPPVPVLEFVTTLVALPRLLPCVDALVLLKVTACQEARVAEAAAEPGRGGVGPVVAPELVCPDKAGPAALVGAGEGSRPSVVAKVSLQVVPLGEGLSDL